MNSSAVVISLVIQEVNEGTTLNEKRKGKKKKKRNNNKTKEIEKKIHNKTKRNESNKKRSSFDFSTETVASIRRFLTVNGRIISRSVDRETRNRFELTSLWNRAGSN